MKLKEDVIVWKEQCKQIKDQLKVVADNQSLQTNEMKVLKELVIKLANTTESMADSILALISQQLGD